MGIPETIQGILYMAEAQTMIALEEEQEKLPSKASLMQKLTLLDGATIEPGTLFFHIRKEGKTLGQISKQTGEISLLLDSELKAFSPLESNTTNRTTYRNNGMISIERRDNNGARAGSLLYYADGKKALEVNYSHAIPETKTIVPDQEPLPESVSFSATQQGRKTRFTLFPDGKMKVIGLEERPAPSIAQLLPPPSPEAAAPVPTETAPAAPPAEEISKATPPKEPPAAAKEELHAKTPETPPVETAAAPPIAPEFGAGLDTAEAIVNQLKNDGVTYPYAIQAGLQKLKYSIGAKKPDGLLKKRTSQSLLACVQDRGYETLLQATKEAQDQLYPKLGQPHVIQPYENLTRLAERLKLPAKSWPVFFAQVEDKEGNPLSDIHTVRAGQKISLPTDTKIANPSPEALERAKSLMESLKKFAPANVSEADGPGWISTENTGQNVTQAYRQRP